MRIFKDFYKLASHDEQNKYLLGLISRSQLSTSLEDEREHLQAEHHEKASQGYQSLHTDTKLAKDNPETLVISFDLEQNLPVPTLTHSSMFYLRQLWV